MHTFVSTSTRQPMFAVAAEKVTGTHLLEAVYGGKVRFAKVRGTGTLRSWPVLEPGSKDRAEAEAIVSAKRSVSEVAKERHVSVATVRRLLTALEFTLELEGMNAKEKAAVAKVANENAAEQPAKEAPKKEETPKEEKPAAKKATPEKPKSDRLPNVTTMRKRLVEAGIYDSMEDSESISVKDVKESYIAWKSEA